MVKVLNYQDTATFYIVGSAGYANSKEILDFDMVDVIFLQNTGWQEGNNQESVTSDAICYPDPVNDFIVLNANRLEGMYIKMPLYGSSDDVSWYKVISATVNRDHLLDNVIDNIELGLKKTSKLDEAGS